MDIRPYSDEYFDSLVSFLRIHWAQNHSIYNKRLFDWQYGGVAADSSSSVMFVDDGVIFGFLGAIPHPFLLNGAVKGATGLAIWIVDKKSRKSIDGLYLRKAVEDNFDVVYAIGINLSVVDLYKKLHYNYHESLNRYVVPLDADGYKRFLTGPAGAGEVEDWVNSVLFAKPAVPSADFDTGYLSRLYARGTAPNFSLLPQKDAVFWSWRYSGSEGFRYLCFHGAGGAVIFREESVHAPEDSSRHGLKCLRIIEILPSDGGVWNGGGSKDLLETIISVLSWGRERGCVLADFQISNSRLGHILEQAGFRMQAESGSTDIARLFAPYRANVPPLNFAYRVRHNGDYLDIGREDTYFLKSDADMDRPNYLPPPA